MNTVPTDQLIDVARKAAKRAADFLEAEYDAVHTHGKTLAVSTKASPIDLVTEIDTKTQQIIIAEIAGHFPDHRFLGEEGGTAHLGNPDCPYEWIIDPLDGTTNFIHGKQNFGTIIAVRDNEKLLAGAMDLPLLGQRLYGGRGAGAFCNDSPVRLRETKNMKDAVLCCNLIHRAKDIDGTLHVTIPPCGSIENYGCAAEELGEILMGHTDGVFFNGIPLWDIAAGFLLVEEAGGKIGMKNHPNGGYVCAASTAPIFEELWEWTQTKM